MLTYLKEKWNKKYLLLIMAVLCLALYFFGSQQNLPDTKFLRPIGYCCLGLGGLLQLITN